MNGVFGSLRDLRLGNVDSGLLTLIIFIYFAKEFLFYFIFGLTVSSEYICYQDTVGDTGLSVDHTIQYTPALKKAFNTSVLDGIA